MIARLAESSPRVSAGSSSPSGLVEPPQRPSCNAMPTSAEMTLFDALLMFAGVRGGGAAEVALAHDVAAPRDHQATGSRHTGGGRVGTRETRGIQTDDGVAWGRHRGGHRRGRAVARGDRAGAAHAIGGGRRCECQQQCAGANCEETSREHAVRAHWDTRMIAHGALDPVDPASALAHATQNH